MQQKACDWDSSSCHSFCSTNEHHFRDLDDKKLNFEADCPESLSKKPSRKKQVFEEGEVLADDSADVEEGEIKDSSSVESCDDSQRCRFFEKGCCSFGEKCLFLHQSDKGLYNMFDRSRLASRSVCNRFRLPLKTETPLSAVSSQEDSANWDRELEEAKLRVGISKKKVPFDELNLTIQTTKILSASPTLENKTSARRVQYRGEGEPGPSTLVASKRNNTRSSETARPLSPKSYRNNKRRYSDSSRSRSRSLSVGRRFSCKCCRTPSPKLGRHASYRLPICCYRRKSISASSSSPSPISKKRTVRRRVRDVANGSRRKRRSGSRKSSPAKTKIQLYIGGAKASVMRGHDREFQTSKTRRDSKSFSGSSPKASKIKYSSHKKNITTMSHSSAKVKKLATSYSPDRRLSDMSISPYSSGSGFGKEPDIRFSSIRHPSDMSISPFSDSPSPVVFSVPVSRADEPASNVAAQNPPPVPRKVAGSDSSAPKKRVKNDVAERNPHVVLPHGPLSKSLTPNKRMRREGQEPKPFAGSRKVPKSVGLVLEKRLKSYVTEPNSSPVPRKGSKSGSSALNTRVKNDVAERNPPIVLPQVPLPQILTPKKIFRREIQEPKRSDGSREMPKSVGPALEKRLRSDFAAQNSPLVPRKVPKSDSSTPKKKVENDIAERNAHVVLPQVPLHEILTPNTIFRREVHEPKPSTGSRKVSKSVGPALEKRLKSDVAPQKSPPVTRKVLKSDNSTPKTRIENDVSERNSRLVLPQVPLSESLTSKNRFRGEVQEPKPSAGLWEVPKSVDPALEKRFKSDVAEPKPPAVQQEMPKSERSTPTSNKIFKNNVAEPKPPAVPQEMPKSESSAPQKRFNHLLFDLMKFHKKDSSTKVAVNTEAAHPPERKEMIVTKIAPKSAAHRGVPLSKKALLLKQLEEVNAAIERKKSHAKKKL